MGRTYFSDALTRPDETSERHTRCALQCVYSVAAGALNLLSAPSDRRPLRKMSRQMRDYFSSHTHVYCIRVIPCIHTYSHTPREMFANAIKRVDAGVALLISRLNNSTLRIYIYFCFIKNSTDYFLRTLNISNIYFIPCAWDARASGLMGDRCGFNFCDTTSIILLVVDRYCYSTALFDTHVYKYRVT